jgi:PleD family two-component response regulator
VASRLCELIELHSFPPAKPGGKPLHITTSIGVVSGAPNLGDDYVERFMARAHAAHYAAKRSGRNRVRTWDETMGLLSDDNHQIAGLGETAKYT